MSGRFAGGGLLGRRLVVMVLPLRFGLGAVHNSEAITLARNFPAKNDEALRCLDAERDTVAAQAVNGDDDVVADPYLFEKLAREDEQVRFLSKFARVVDRNFPGPTQNLRLRPAAPSSPHTFEASPPGSTRVRPHFSFVAQ